MGSTCNNARDLIREWSSLIAWVNNLKKEVDTLEVDYLILRKGGKIFSGIDHDIIRTYIYPYEKILGKVYYPENIKSEDKLKIANIDLGISTLIFDVADHYNSFIIPAHLPEVAFTQCKTRRDLLNAELAIDYKKIFSESLFELVSGFGNGEELKIKEIILPNYNSFNKLIDWQKDNFQKAFSEAIGLKLKSAELLNIIIIKGYVKFHDDFVELRKFKLSDLNPHTIEYLRRKISDYRPGIEFDRTKTNTRDAAAIAFVQMINNDNSNIFATLVTDVEPLITVINNLKLSKEVIYDRGKEFPILRTSNTFLVNRLIRGQIDELKPDYERVYKEIITVQDRIVEFKRIINFLRRLRISSCDTCKREHECPNINIFNDIKEKIDTIKSLRLKANNLLNWAMNSSIKDYYLSNAIDISGIQEKDKLEKALNLVFSDTTRIRSKLVKLIDELYKDSSRETGLTFENIWHVIDEDQKNNIIIGFEKVMALPFSTRFKNNTIRSVIDNLRDCKIRKDIEGIDKGYIDAFQLITNEDIGEERKLLFVLLLFSFDKLDECLKVLESINISPTIDENIKKESRYLYVQVLHHIAQGHYEKHKAIKLNKYDEQAIIFLEEERNNYRISHRVYLYLALIYTRAVELGMIKYLDDAIRFGEQSLLNVLKKYDKQTSIIYDFTNDSFEEILKTTIKRKLDKEHIPRIINNLIYALIFKKDRNRIDKLIPLLDISVEFNIEHKVFQGWISPILHTKGLYYYKLASSWMKDSSIGERLRYAKIAEEQFQRAFEKLSESFLLKRDKRTIKRHLGDAKKLVESLSHKIKKT